MVTTLGYSCAMCGAKAYGEHNPDCPERIVTGWPMPPMTQAQLTEVRAGVRRLMEAHPERYTNLRRFAATHSSGRSRQKWTEIDWIALGGVAVFILLCVAVAILGWSSYHPALACGG